MKITPEGFKGGVHFVMGGLALSIGLHNTLMFLTNKSRRNALNALVFLGVSILECSNTYEHWKTR